MGYESPPERSALLRAWDDVTMSGRPISAGLVQARLEVIGQQASGTSPARAILLAERCATAAP